MEAMAEPASDFQEWLLSRSQHGTPAGLAANLLRAFEADNPILAPVFVAHAWQEHLVSEASREARESAEAQQQVLEEAFHGRLGLDADADGGLALELGRAVDRSLEACHCFLHLTAQPMPDGLSWFRLEIRDSAAPSSGPGNGDAPLIETVKVIVVDSHSQAQAIIQAIHTVLEARGFQARAELGLFHLQGPQLVALVAILKQLALRDTEASMALST